MLIKLLFAIFFVISLFLIFDARPIARKYFTLNKRNETVIIIRIIGIIMYVIIEIIYINFKNSII